MTQETVPPLRVRESDGAPNVIPVYDVILSDNLTLVNRGAGVIVISATTGASSSSSTVYAATANSYVVLATATDLTAERVLTASTGLGLVDGGANGNASLSVNTNIRDKSIAFYLAGNLGSGTIGSNARYYVPFNVQLIDCRLAVSTSAAGDNIIVNPTIYDASTVLANSQAIFTSANRPQVITNSLVGSGNVFAIGNVTAGSFLGVNIDQVGSSVAGSNLTVVLIVRSS